MHTHIFLTRQKRFPPSQHSISPSLWEGTKDLYNQTGIMCPIHAWVPHCLLASSLWAVVFGNPIAMPVIRRSQNNTIQPENCSLEGIRGWCASFISHPSNAPGPPWKGGQGFFFNDSSTYPLGVFSPLFSPRIPDSQPKEPWSIIPSRHINIGYLS